MHDESIERDDAASLGRLAALLQQGVRRGGCGADAAPIPSITAAASHADQTSPDHQRRQEHGSDPLRPVVGPPHAGNQERRAQRPIELTGRVGSPADVAQTIPVAGIAGSRPRHRADHSGQRRRRAGRLRPASPALTAPRRPIRPIRQPLPQPFVLVHDPLRG